MDVEKRSGLASLLETLPPVEFGCIYGSSIHANNSGKTSMIDYILGVADPDQWHAELNRNHYASWMVHLGGARLITGVADNIGVGVHFNPFVFHENQMFKYGVVRMHDLVQDILEWERFYVSGRLQKPVNVIVDNLEIKKLNSVNLKSVSSAALLLLPSDFSEEELYAKICSLSYMGDLRMLFAEDKNKVKKIVEGQFALFQRMYNPLLEELAACDLFRISSSVDRKVNIIQDCGLSSTCSLVSNLPPTVRSEMGIKLGEEKVFDESGQAVRKVVIKSREEAAYCMQKILRRKVMVSSGRQAVAGLVTAGAVHGFRYLGSKMHKAWKSWWKIPAEFMKRYGHNLPNRVGLKVPSGSTMEVELNHSNDITMLQKGWIEFKERYSIGYGQFLMFEYNGKSEFNVVIFDKTALEINYPSDADDHSNKRIADDRKHPESEDTNGIVESDDSAVSLEESSGTGNKKKRKAGYQENDEARARTSESKLYEPSPEEEYSTGSESTERVEMQRYVAKETSMAYHKAAAFVSDHISRSPYFICLMQHSYVSYGFCLYVPVSFARRNQLCEGANSVTLVAEGKKWSVRCLWRNSRADVSLGWKRFVQDNRLKVGDACIFEVVKSNKLVWDVVIFRI
ncbi:hypothetical protein OROGR_007841 [Orobanche gracilis]